MKQLMDKIKYEPEYMQRFIIILMETGRRVSEICALPFDCLEQDSQDDWYLRVQEYKMKKIRLIPISAKCIDAIQKQQEYVTNTQSSNFYLFPTRSKHKSPHLSVIYVNQTLACISGTFDIKDINGKPWRFISHQFRHTVGTQMINNGVPQIMVQHYLGHESSEMTSRYAHIHNETMKTAFVEYQGKLIDIHGEPKAIEDLHDGQWLKANITTQSLPNGLCALPITQSKCPHANACLTYANFRTGPEHLPIHKKQLEETSKVINNAKQQGWDRVVESNVTVAKNLKKIICKLEA